MNWYKKASDLPGKKPEGVGGFYSTPFAPSQTNDMAVLVDEIRQVKRNKPNSSIKEILIEMGYLSSQIPPEIINDLVNQIEKDPYHQNSRSTN